MGSFSGSGAEEIDARGLLATPGFVDIHTHYDGQATWANRLDPSSRLGVTSVVMGNCGVGFAPCRPADHDALVRLMEGVEDIPEVVLTEGLPWNWETFPDYMDALAQRHYDLDVAAQIGHAPLRVYVMGERGTNREPATAEDRREMARLVGEALQAGALGFSTSRTINHRTSDGKHTPTFAAGEEELAEIAMAIRTAGRGVLQLISDFDEVEDEFAMIRRVAKRAGRPLSLSLLQNEQAPERWQRLLDLITRAVDDGLPIKAQVASRGVGIVMGLELTRHPLVWQPGYREIAHLPLADRVEALRQPERRARILSEAPVDAYQYQRTMRYERIFEIDVYPEYEPAPDASIAAKARQRGVRPEELVYDLLLEEDGTKKLYRPIFNYLNDNYDDVLAMMRHRDTVVGLGDGGAHCGIICDASFSTYMLSHWVRDRTRGDRVPLAWAVRAGTREPAETVGLLDRGLLKRGYKGDLNLIDMDKLRLRRPEVTYDLPAGGRRLMQQAEGFVATIVSGTVTYRDGSATGALPGRLIRGAQGR